MIKKLLVAHGEGLGNVCQILPTVRTIRETLGYEMDFWHIYGSFQIPKFFNYVDKWFVGRDISKMDPSDYIGKVSTFWTLPFMNSPALMILPLLGKSDKVRPDRSEVDTYMDIARDLGVKEENILWYGKCGRRIMDRHYDIAIHDGYNRKSPDKSWRLKSYPYYDKVVELLPEFNICSLGGKDEVIKGTTDETGLDLLSTLGIISNSKLFVGNDSGLYHCANALGVRNIVIFTYTSTIKNYNSEFHKYTKILQNYELDCLSCQNTSRFKTCTTRDCREIDPEIVADEIRRGFNG